MKSSSSSSYLGQVMGLTSLLLLFILPLIGSGGGQQQEQTRPASRLPFWQNIIPDATRLLRDLTSTGLDTLAGYSSNNIRRDGEEPEVKEVDPDARRNTSQVIESRGFRAEEYDVVTRDGYILTIQRIINPLVAEAKRRNLKPVILQHGLMSSSIDWVIQSVEVRPKPWPRDNNNNRKDQSKAPNSLGFYLANEGYDVFLSNSRGNIYGQRHIHLNSWQPKFWDFTFDEQIKYDLPDTIELVQKLTNHSKVGYVGHSQGTVIMFGLLSDQPQYADVVEPFVALAPVAYCSHAKSPAKYFSVYTPLFQNINMWFGTSNAAVRYLAPIVCGPKVVRRELCANIVFLSVGFDEEELDESRIQAYLAHMPSGTSVKNIAHYGQEVLSDRFAHFDHGVVANQIIYGQPHPPDYQLANIRSRSIALFTAENDWLASPRDVAHLRADLKVPLFRVMNVTELKPKWNHLDFVYGKDAGELVNTRILDVFRHFSRTDEGGRQK